MIAESISISASLKMLPMLILLRSGLQISGKANQMTIYMEAQNLLSGPIVLGDLSLVKSLQAIRSPIIADVNGLSPYFGRPLALAASWGHLHIVHHLHSGTDPHLTSHAEHLTDWDRKEGRYKCSAKSYNKQEPISD